jgi:hypothetical protein
MSIVIRLYSSDEEIKNANEKLYICLIKSLMKQIKDELQSIIIGNGQDGQNSQLKKVHNFLRGNAQASTELEEQKHLKSEEESLLIDFALKENLNFSDEISITSSILSGIMTIKIPIWGSFLKTCMMRMSFVAKVCFIL